MATLTESLRTTLLSLAGESQLAPLLDDAARRLANEPDVALARIWLRRPGDRCAQCPHREPCPTPGDPCLHLVSSDGHPRSKGADWQRLDGDFSRIPPGFRKIGRVGDGELICVENVEDDDEWIAHPDWARREAIVGFGGAPLRFQGELLGAVGVFTRRPFDAEAVDWLRLLADHLASAIANARAFEEISRLRRELERENLYLREEVEQAKALGPIVGTSAALGAIRERIALVAPTDASVLIEGESGTGKELVAREIHRASARSERPLISMNCAAIPHELAESEFFGHARGAFSGAFQERDGRFAAADGGTLFLDEVGELPLDLQAKLLRVLEDGTYQRVGEVDTRTADVRIISATNRDLARAVERGAFREDLYYRLNVFPLTIPPLRERRDDIGPLATVFFENALSKRPGDSARPRLTERALSDLRRRDWPGNARELRNAVERAVISWRGGALRFDGPPRADIPTEEANGDEPRVLTASEWSALEARNLRAALLLANGRISGPNGAAARLDMNPSTLRSRLKTLGIQVTKHVD